MRRVLVLLFTVSALGLALVSPVAAATPIKQSGTISTLDSFSTTCGSGAGLQTCTDTYLSVYPAFDEATGTLDPNHVEVCVYSATYTVSRTGRGRLLSQESGCTLTDASALTVSSNLTATLSATTVDLYTFNCTRIRCTQDFSRTVTVSASDTLVGDLLTSSGRGSFTQGGCTYRYSFTMIEGQVAGTLTIDGTTLDESGYASSQTFKVSQTCR